MEYKIRPALTIIDLQNGFISPGGSYDKFGFQVAQYQRVVPVVSEVYRWAKSLKIPVFFSQALREKSGIDMLDKVHKILPPKRRERIAKTPLCIRGTWDADIVDAVKPSDNDLIVHKRRDSIFQDTEFGLWLRALCVDTLIFTGIDTSICVESSLRDAFNRGWDVILVSDATASLHDDFYQTTLSEVETNFGLVLKSSQLLSSLEPCDDNMFILRV